MYDANVVNQTLTGLQETDFCDSVTLKAAIEQNNVGDVVKDYFTIISSLQRKLEALPARYVPAGTVVNRSAEPKTVTETSKIIILGFVDNFTESSIVILNDTRTFRISEIISNNQFLTVIQVEDIAI